MVADVLSRKSVQNLTAMITTQQQLLMKMRQFDLKVVALGGPHNTHMSLVIRPALLERIKREQSSNPELQKARGDIESARAGQFSWIRRALFDSKTDYVCPRTRKFLRNY